MDEPRICPLTGTAVLLLSLASAAQPGDPRTNSGEWRGFRGTDGVATHAGERTPAPGATTRTSAGARRCRAPARRAPSWSGDSVFITCWSGYGIDPAAPGAPKELRRHLLRVARADGEILWSVAIEPVPEEDTFDGRMAGHGYASSTPVSDGRRIYVFFGKAGVFAFDLAGRAALANQRRQGIEPVEDRFRVQPRARRCTAVRQRFRREPGSRGTRSRVRRGGVAARVEALGSGIRHAGALARRRTDAAVSIARRGVGPHA